MFSPSSISFEDALRAVHSLQSTMPAVSDYQRRTEERDAVNAFFDTHPDLSKTSAARHLGLRRNTLSNLRARRMRDAFHDRIYAAVAPLLTSSPGDAVYESCRRKNARGYTSEMRTKKLRRMALGPVVQGPRQRHARYALEPDDEENEEYEEEKVASSSSPPPPQPTAPTLPPILRAPAPSQHVEFTIPGGTLRVVFTPTQL